MRFSPPLPSDWNAGIWVRQEKARPFLYQHQKFMRTGGTLRRTRCAGMQYRVSTNTHLLDPSTANTFLIPNFILWIHITDSSVRQEDSWKQNNVGRNYIGIIIIIIRRWIQLAFTSLKNLCGIMIIWLRTASPKGKWASGIVQIREISRWSISGH
jgi:hypothetical protein